MPWTVIQESETNALIGILGAHLHTIKTANEYKGIEICYALDPAYRMKSVLSNAFRTFARSFAPQLNNLGDEFNRILAPISPINFPSLKFALSLGFEVGKDDSPDQPYVSGYFPELVNESEKPRLLSYAGEVVKKLRENPDMVEPNRNSFEEPIEDQDWEKLRALRVVVSMPKKDFLNRFFPK